MTMTRDEKNQEQLRHLVKRLNSISIALQQVVDGKAKWSKCKEEYAEVVSLGEKMVRVIEQL